MNFYLHALQATERRWRRPCCHGGGDCDDVDDVDVGDDNDYNDGGDGVAEKFVVVDDDIARDVIDVALDVECRDDDGDDCDDTDDGDGGDGGGDGDDDDDGGDDGDWVRPHRFHHGTEDVASDRVVREASWNFWICDSCDHFA